VDQDISDVDPSEVCMGSPSRSQPEHIVPLPRKPARFGRRSPPPINVTQLFCLIRSNLQCSARSRGPRPPPPPPPPRRRCRRHRRRRCACGATRDARAPARCCQGPSLTEAAAAESGAAAASPPPPSPPPRRLRCTQGRPGPGPVLPPPGARGRRRRRRRRRWVAARGSAGTLRKPRAQCSSGCLSPRTPSLAHPARVSSRPGPGPPAQRSALLCRTAFIVFNAASAVHTRRRCSVAFKFGQAFCSMRPVGKGWG
jgi:hypothetical protein